MQIDNNKGQKLRYAVACSTSVRLKFQRPDAMIASLKKGSDVIFTSINFRRAAFLRLAIVVSVFSVASGRQTA